MDESGITKGGTNGGGGDGPKKPDDEKPVAKNTDEPSSPKMKPLAIHPDDEEEHHAAVKKRKPGDPQFESWAASERARLENALQNEKDGAKRKQLEHLLQNHDESLDNLCDYLKKGGCLSVSKDKKILYVASDEDNNKWLQLKMIVDPETKQQSEFIGIHRSFFANKKLTEKDAMAIIDLAQMKGWQSVKLHGNQDEKSLLWLAAMRHGMPVDMNGFVPSQEHIEHWKKEQALRAELASANALVGVTPPPPPEPPAAAADIKSPPPPTPVAPAAASKFTNTVKDPIIKSSTAFKKAVETPLFKTPDTSKAPVLPALPIKQRNPTP